MLTVDDDHLGTPESDWQRSGRLGSVAPLHLESWQHVVVVAPHPDDEVLGAGGLLRMVAASGAAISVIAVTDGESSHPGSPAAASIDLRVTRAEERLVALDRLLPRSPTLTRLGLPDGGVAAHEDQLRSDLAAVLSHGTLCVAPWAADGHPDHDSAGRAALAAAGEKGCDLLAYLVWAWHWARPDNDDLPWDRCRQVRLSRRDAARKRWSTAAFRSQIRPLGPHPDDGPVLPDAVVRRSWRTSEVFVIREGS